MMSGLQRLVANFVNLIYLKHQWDVPRTVVDKWYNVTKYVYISKPKIRYVELMIATSTQWFDRKAALEIIYFKMNRSTKRFIFF